MIHSTTKRVLVNLRVEMPEFKVHSHNSECCGTEHEITYAGLASKRRDREVKSSIKISNFLCALSILSLSP